MPWDYLWLKPTAKRPPCAPAGPALARSLVCIGVLEIDGARAFGAWSKTFEASRLYQYIGIAAASCFTNHFEFACSISELEYKTPIIKAHVSAS